MILNNNLLDKINNALLICDSQGEIKKTNQVFKIFLLQLTQKSTISTIFEIDPLFCATDITKEKYISKKVYIKELKFNVNICKVKYNSDICYLYLFEKTIITSKILDSVINLVDDAIGISNQNGVIEKVNDTFCKITGTNKENLIGYNVKELKYMMDTEPITLKVLQSKKPLNMNIKYKNGKTVTYTAIPLFDENGELIRVIGTGRDISELIKLEERLKETERKKSKYYNKLQEINNKVVLKNFIYSSEKMEKIILTASKVAKTNSSVFLVGESGVGKEIVARLIHNTSPRKDKPFIAINCAAIPSELLESELFGYDEGTFTGGKRNGRKGLLSQANGGTIFLDEIGELSIKMQSKLLRVIQDNGFIRLGGNEFIPIDVRYLSATNLTKKELKNNNIFRQDLYYRLSVLPIYIPPLRERKKDILPLVNYFLESYNHKYNSNIRLSREVLEHLYKQNWPGNVRELKNLIERLIILSDKDKLNMNDFFSINNYGKEKSLDENLGIIIKKIIPLKDAHLLLEDTIINKAIMDCGSIVKAAKALNIAPSTIYRKINRGEIEISNNI